METENESQSLPPVTKSGSTVEIVSRQDDDSFIEVDSQPKTELSTVQSDATEPPPSAANDHQATIGQVVENVAVLETSTDSADDGNDQPQSDMPESDQSELITTTTTTAQDNQNKEVSESAVPAKENKEEETADNKEDAKADGDVDAKDSSAPSDQTAQESEEPVDKKPTIPFNPESLKALLDELKPAKAKSFRFDPIVQKYRLMVNTEEDNQEEGQVLTQEDGQESDDSDVMVLEEVKGHHEEEEPAEVIDLSSDEELDPAAYAAIRNSSALVKQRMLEKKRRADRVAYNMRGRLRRGTIAPITTYKPQAWERPPAVLRPEQPPTTVLRSKTMPTLGTKAVIHRTVSTEHLMRDNEEYLLHFRPDPEPFDWGWNSNSSNVVDCSYSTSSAPGGSRYSGRAGGGFRTDQRPLMTDRSRDNAMRQLADEAVQCAKRKNQYRDQADQDEDDYLYNSGRPEKFSRSGPPVRVQSTYYPEPQPPLRGVSPVMGPPTRGSPSLRQPLRGSPAYDVEDGELIDDTYQRFSPANRNPQYRNSPVGHSPRLQSGGSFSTYGQAGQRDERLNPSFGGRYQYNEDYPQARPQPQPQSRAPPEPQPQRLIDRREEIRRRTYEEIDSAPRKLSPFSSLFAPSGSGEPERHRSPQFAPSFIPIDEDEDTERIPPQDLNKFMYRKDQRYHAGPASQPSPPARQSFHNPSWEDDDDLPGPSSSFTGRPLGRGRGQPTAAGGARPLQPPPPLPSTLQSALAEKYTPTRQVEDEDEDAGSWNQEGEEEEPKIPNPISKSFPPPGYKPIDPTMRRLPALSSSRISRVRR